MGFLRLMGVKVRDVARRWRGRLVDFALRGVYGVPVRVTPVAASNQMGVAGAVVLWYMQDNFRHFVMVKARGADTRARFVSSLGFAGLTSMQEALKASVAFQLGAVFAKTLGENALAPDRVAAAPVFSLTDEATGLAMPVQSLVWVVQLQATQVELIMAGPGCTPVLVPEFGLASAKVSPTHRALVEAVRRFLPNMKTVKAEPTPEQLEEAGVGSGRVLH